MACAVPRLFFFLRLYPQQFCWSFALMSWNVLLSTSTPWPSVQVRVVCATKFLRINHSADTRIYACINTRPVIGSGNKNIEMAPYNIHYPALEHHMQVSACARIRKIRR